MIALLFVAQFAYLQYAIRNWKETDFSAFFFLGNDFTFLYNAAGHFFSGTSPYLEKNFVPLPSALYLPMLLHPLPFWDAVFAYRLICFVLVVIAILWLCRQLGLTFINSALLLVITVTYGPFYTLLAGGNLDALMLVFLVFACAKQVWMRGAFLGLSIGTKFYSLLLLPILLLRRRWREVCWALAVLILLLLPFSRYLPDALTSVSHRTSTLRLQGNESPAVLFILLFGEKNVWLWRSCYVLLWGGTLLVRMAADALAQASTDDERFRALEYLPWMAAAPVLVFTYTGTILLAFIALIVRKNQDHKLNWPDWLIVAGFLITGIFPFIASQAANTILRFLGVGLRGVPTILMLLPPLGISAILLGSSAGAWFDRPNKNGSIRNIA